MQTRAITTAVCPECGTRLEGAFSRSLGRCMICLLRVGFDEAEEPDDKSFAPVTDRLGNYRIQRRDDGTAWELGHGAMGVTYRAVDTSLQRPVALKLIAPEWVKRGAEARERFMREARTAAALRHPNVATVYHFGIREENGQCFCAMELVDGETLETRVRRTGPLDALTTIEIALQVCSALAAAEKQGLVHRDLKPANLMLVENVEVPITSGPLSRARKNPTRASHLLVKVIDFGVAKALVEKPDAMGITHGGFVGTPAFASPEQFTDAPVDVRSDIYSLGGTLWYLLTGHRPFEGATIEQIRASQRSQALPIAQLKAARVPSRFISLLVSMLAPEPAARPAVRALTLQLQNCRAQILDRWKAARRSALAAGLIGIALAVVLLFPQKCNQPFSGAGDTSSISPKSIAVLPFQNLSEEKENAFFADGIQDDLVTSLARIKDLKVVSRGSVASYRDLSRRKLRTIAQELGVGAVLEGSVRRSGNRVLVNVQLIDAMTEKQIWSDRYDRTLQDSIALQGELAAEIATALAAKISPEEKAQVEAKLTNNPDAYIVYLRGREIQMRPEVSRDNYLAAEQCYRHAVALDPRFALAHARLAEILEGRYGWFDHQPALLAEARNHAEEALRLDPHCGQAHMEMAIILSYSAKSSERDKAIKQEVDSALRLAPNDGYMVMIAALFQSDMDWLDEAETTFQRAIEINPREPKVFYNYFTLLTKKGDVAKARWASDRSLELAPESVYFRLNRANEEFLWTGEVARTKKFLAEIPAGKDPDGRVTTAYCSAAVYERDFPEALRLLAACPSERLPFLEGAFIPKAFVEGLIHFYAGNKERAYAALDSVRWILEMEAKEDAGDQGVHFAVAMAYAAMGWKDAALTEIARAKEKLDAWPMAVLLVHAGKCDAALRHLEQLPAREREHYYHDLRLHPKWDPLRNDARFEKMLASSAPKIVAVPEKSIAVLPFRNLSEDKDNAFFADGIQEELLILLSKVPQLQVAARTSSFSFKNKPIEISEIARKLHVANVLEGSVRKSGDHLRITAQLVRAAEGYNLWSETYDRKLDDIFKIQDEIAGEVVKQLKVTLLGAAPTVRQTHPKAYTLYLQAVQIERQGAPGAFMQSDALLKQVLEIDPRYAPAWHELARNFINKANDGLLPNSEGYARAREAEEKALSIDPNYAPAHAGLGRIAMVNNDFVSAAKHFERALTLDPNDINVLGNSATFLQSLGRLQEGLALREALVRRDPINLTTLHNLGIAQQSTKQFDAAIASFRSLLSLSPSSGGAHSWMCEAMLLKGDAPAALAEIEQEKSEVWRLIGLPMAYHALGRKTQSDAALATLIAKDEKWGPYNIAYIYAFRGEADKAFEWLDKAVRYQDPGLTQIVGENLFDNIHSDPRWLPFLRKIRRAPEQLAEIQFKVSLPP